MHILCPLLRLIKHNAGISHSSPSRYSILQPKLSPDTSLPSPQDYLNTGQVQDLWKDADFIRVCNKCMKQLAVCHCCGNCFQFVTTEIQLFQVLQLTEFAERETKDTILTGKNLSLSEHPFPLANQLHHKKIADTT